MKQNTPISTGEKRTRRSAVPRSLGFILAAAILVVAAAVVRSVTQPPDIEASAGTGSDRVVTASFLVPTELDRLIGEYESRIESHTDASDYRILGGLYMEKGRQTGDISRYTAAATAYQQAVDLAPSDPIARLGVGSAAYAMHEFEEASEVAQLVHDATGRLDALALLFDSTLALGRYEQAQTLLEKLKSSTEDNPAVAARQAEWARLNGDGSTALRLANEAVGITAESRNPRLRSWYLAFAGNMHFQLGEYQTGLELAASASESDPQSRTAAATLGRLHAATGDLDAAITQMEIATSEIPDPALLAELSDLYLATGQVEKAEETFSVLEVTATLSEAAGVYDRAIALSLADRAVEIDRTVSIAEAELEQRQDVGAYDTYSWALFAAGRYEEAAAASESALAFNTVDARFHYHAGMIDTALGRDEAALAHFDTALRISPQFHPAHADRARASIADLS